MCMVGVMSVDKPVQQQACGDWTFFLSTIMWALGTLVIRLAGHALLPAEPFYQSQMWTCSYLLTQNFSSSNTEAIKNCAIAGHGDTHL